ncbi:class I SAM-dependent methyltransferase [Adhaeribacter swui]|uniref:Class I SAM-dependent methyltransferase n=1 Tax=Adhaeribacter swui TaxID=2086471 RepID=A0A7G7GFI8_9BACT|nr:class I SAM-dependent methyltransferase [Adhaeribacter swui]
MFALRQVFLYLQHSLKSTRLHGIHSPFVFSLHNQVIRHKGNFYSFSEIEDLRKQLKVCRDIIQVQDFGAGSRVTNKLTKTIRHIVLNAATPPDLAQLLFRLVNFQNAAVILELGTSLGLTTAYLASANTKATVYSLEGCPTTAQQASENLKNLKINNVNVITGNFEDTLPALLPNLPCVDFVLFDGNHRLAPTLRYFDWCRAKATEASVFVFDDINWSPEMQQAWRQICAHPAVTISVDLFHLGLVFFRKNQPKQHFNIRF